MKYDIVPVDGSYRGMGRSLLTTHIFRWVPNDQLFLDKYFSYLANMTSNDSATNFKNMISFYEDFQRKGIPCEAIAYDRMPLDSAFGYKLTFLGIDIVHEMSESLLNDTELSKDILGRLNENGLCTNENDARTLIPRLKPGEANWSCCYVYHINV